MLDEFDKRQKADYEKKAFDVFAGRCYDFKDLMNPDFKKNILYEAEIFYRDHISKLTSSDASHHDIAKKFPNLNEKYRKMISEFSEKIKMAGDDIQSIIQILAEYDITTDYLGSKLKSAIKQRDNFK